jgi:hypothetical protein
MATVIYYVLSMVQARFDPVSSTTLHMTFGDHIQSLNITFLSSVSQRYSMSFRSAELSPPMKRRRGRSASPEQRENTGNGGGRSSSRNRSPGYYRQSRDNGYADRSKRDDEGGSRRRRDEGYSERERERERDLERKRYDEGVSCSGSLFEHLSRC